MTAAPAARSALLSGLAGIRHGYFGRKGGVSAGIYDSLNCGPGSSDAPEAVRENRARVSRTLGAEHLLSLYQVHGVEAITVREAWENGASRPRCDAMVTDRPGLALGTLAADCGPVLFADADAGVIGAAHAGWKGALAGVLESTVTAMESLGARRERIRAALGPTIAPESYEVGPEFPAPFLAEHGSNERFFSAGARPGKHRFDLPGYIVARLARIGVAAEWTGHDTLALEADYFSYRRTTLAGGGDYGRNVSAIVLDR
ncbi:MAG: peptidoglycan editing factor PgeF [Candidatus Odyssella sp.]|nr:peptidoglycan editing factor PgeF [Candidatus Odyssella sp.]